MARLRPMSTAAGSPPNVSVVMPVYNGERHLAEALDSLLAQTYQDFEIVAVDDGSTDGSLRLLEHYAERDPRVRPHALPENRGHHVSSTEAMRLARGRYLVRHDQDDVALPRRIEASLDALRAHPGTGFVNSAYLRWLPDGTLIPRCPPLSHTGLRVALTFGNVVCHSAVTIDRDAVPAEELHYRDLPGPQDYDLWIRLLDHTEGLTLAEPLAVYRQETMAMTAQYSDRMEQAVALLSAEQMHDLVAETAVLPIRRLHSFRPQRGDGRYVAELRHVYEALAGTSSLDDAEVRDLHRAWTARALRSALSPRQPFPLRPGLVAALVRHCPTAALSAVRRGA